MDDNLYSSYETASSTFLPFSGLSINSVWYLSVEDCLATVILKFENECLIIKANAEDDSIQLSRASRPAIDQILQSANPAEGVWSKYVGQKFGWGWIAINQQNYFDAVLLSFNDIVPNLLLNVIASSLHVFEISEVSDIIDEADKMR